MNIIAAILAGTAATNNNVTGFSQVGNTLTLEYGIAIFLAMVFVAALVSSRTKIHTMYFWASEFPCRFLVIQD